MLVVKDSMVLIHLAKITLLQSSCEYFGNVLIPEEVFQETVEAGKKIDREDAHLIEQLIKKNMIQVKTMKEKKLIKIANEFNIFKGEAAALALYKQEKAQLLISDDYSLRKKKDLIQANIIGSLAVLLTLKRKNKISLEKFKDAINKLRTIGWFSNAILDKVLMEGEQT